MNSFMSNYLVSIVVFAISVLIYRRYFGMRWITIVLFYTVLFGLSTLNHYYPFSVGCT